MAVDYSVGGGGQDRPPIFTQSTNQVGHAYAWAVVCWASFTLLTAEVQLRNKVRASTVRSSNDGPPRTSTRQCCPGLIGCIPVMAPVAKTMPARTVGLG
jgi:hypothetical protein